MIETHGYGAAELLGTLTDREKKVLTLTVYYYIASGDPVGSRFVSKKLDLDLSPATVRNVMADLEEKGLLRQTHISSGRVPTDAGYRCYVELNILSKRARPVAIRQIRETLAGRRLTMEEAFQETSKALSAVSRQLSLVVGPKFMSDRFRRLQFVRIGPRRALAVIVTDNRLVQNRMLDLPEEWSQEELNAMSEIWNRRFAARPVREVRAELLEGMAADKAEFDRLVEASLVLGKLALLDEAQEESLYLEGTRNLLEWSEFASPGRLRRLMAAIEEKSRLLHLLDRSMRADGIQICIGGEMPFPELKDMSLITAPYGKEGQILGVLGVIGPTRMEYSRVIPIVEYTAASLSEYLSLE